MTIAMPPYIHANSRRIAIVSAGESAIDFLGESDQLRIIAVFRRCFYCEDNDGNVVCIGAPSVDKGPFTLKCNQEEITHFPECKEGNHLHFQESHLHLAGSYIFFDLENAVEWHCPLA